MKQKHYDSIAKELLMRVKADQSMRNKAMEDASYWDDSIDRSNTARLKDMIKEIGWPTISKVGAEASRGAWLIVQHATAEPDFMKHCLSLMKEEAKNGDVELANVAYLEDRLLTMEGKPQVYGTQFLTVNGDTKPFPIIDPEHVDERRTSVGLDSFAENESRVRKMSN